MSSNLEKIKEVLYVLSKDQMTPRQLELATRLLTKTVQEIANKQLEISENTKKAIAEVLSSVSEQNKATGGQIEALEPKIEALKVDNQAVLDQALATLEKVKTIKGEKGDKGDTVVIEKIIERTEVIKEPSSKIYFKPRIDDAPENPNIGDLCIIEGTKEIFIYE
jgi:hypothetical protein